MILVLEPNALPESADYRMLIAQLERLPKVQFRIHREVGSEVTLTEIYLIGNTGTLTVEQMQVLPGVAKVVRVSEAYRVLGRHKQGDDEVMETTHFDLVILMAGLDRDAPIALSEKIKGKKRIIAGLPFVEQKKRPQIF